MTDLRFEGRTAIVTGAGGNPGLGRSFALALAARGAAVVVNDIGRDPQARGYSDVASAEAVVEEIRTAGGRAVADTSSVADPDGAKALIATAIETFGGVDILVNNAGISIAAEVDEMSDADCRRHMDVNLNGCLWTARAAWRHMRAAGYGRIVNVASGAIAGFALLAAYGASKGGVFALSRALAAEGAAHGIKVNSLNPGAFTRMLAAQQEETGVMYKLAQASQPADLVAPVVVYLAHEDCPVSGECIEAVSGGVRRFYLVQTVGFEDPALTAETVAARWGEVMGGEPSLVEVARLDTRDWHMKDYRA